MRVALLTTGTELLLGDVRDAHLSFVASEILPLGLRIAEQRTIPDGSAIRQALAELLPGTDVLFTTGGLGPTTDDVTREMIAEVLGLKLVPDPKVMEAITERLNKRGIKFTDRIGRQADVPKGARVLPNRNGTAPGFYFPPAISATLNSPHLFVLPGPPRELQPMFRESVLPILRSIVPAPSFDRRIYRIANIGESLVEQAIGQKILALPGIEIGYCARPGETDVRLIGDGAALEQADAVVRGALGPSIFSTTNENLEEVIVKLLTVRQQTLALAESCTGGLLANRITNVPGASVVFRAGYVVYANAAKIDLLNVESALIEEQGAVSEPVARAMAEGARRRSGATFAIATTGLAGPGGGSKLKPVGTVYIGIASPNTGGATVHRFFFPNDRETFKQMTAQAAFGLLRKQILGDRGNS